MSLNGKEGQGMDVKVKEGFYMVQEGCSKEWTLP
jgi:hypothetical protein